MGVSPAAMTTIIDRLEQSGFAKRKREGSDRRSFTVHAREESDKEVTKLYRSLQAAATKLNADYSEQELRLIFGYLQKATGVLNIATSKLLLSTKCEHKSCLLRAWSLDRPSKIG
jgi:DNA-binding MarR family transcriptional regulator